MNRNDVKFVTDNQPLSILLRIHTITFYIRRLTKIAPRTGASNCHTEFSKTGCPVAIVTIHSYLSKMKSDIFPHGNSKEKHFFFSLLNLIHWVCFPYQQFKLIFLIVNWLTVSHILKPEHTIFAKTICTHGCGKQHVHSIRSLQGSNNYTK